MRREAGVVARASLAIHHLGIQPQPPAADEPTVVKTVFRNWETEQGELPGVERRER